MQNIVINAGKESALSTPRSLTPKSRRIKELEEKAARAEEEKVELEERVARAEEKQAELEEVNEKQKKEAEEAIALLSSSKIIAQSDTLLAKLESLKVKGDRAFEKLQVKEGELQTKKDDAIRSILTGLCMVGFGAGLAYAAVATAGVLCTASSTVFGVAVVASSVTIGALLLSSVREGASL